MYNSIGFRAFQSRVFDLMRKSGYAVMSDKVRFSYDRGLYVAVFHDGTKIVARPDFTEPTRKFSATVRFGSGHQAMTTL